MLNAEQKYIKKFPVENFKEPILLLPCVETVSFLLCNIPDNSVIVLDNASFHNKSRLSTLISHSNKKIVFLPPYSPDLNPIEKFWANLKSFLRFSLSSFASLDLALSSFFKVN